MDPFLTFITPTYRRPLGLQRCMASVQAQTAVEAIEHLILPDYIGRGVGGMFAEMPKYTAAVHGQYVHLLADDDELASPDVVATVKSFAEAHGNPQVILVAANKGGVELPIGDPWPPLCGRIDLGCLITRADIWTKHAKDYGTTYEGDWAFADALYKANRTPEWCDVLFLNGAVSRGAAEAA